MIATQPNVITVFIWLGSRGGVEDTRLEAKDTKKFEAKDSPSEDRTSRGQGHTRKCSSKKKEGFQKFFSGGKGLKNFFFRRSPIAENKKGFCKFSTRFLAFSN